MEEYYLEMYEYDNAVDNRHSGSVHERSTDGTPSAAGKPLNRSPYLSSRRE